MNDLSAVTSFICVLQTASTRLLLKLLPSSGTALGGRLCPLLGTAQCTGWWCEVLSCCFLPPFPLLPLFQCIFLSFALFFCYTLFFISPPVRTGMVAQGWQSTCLPCQQVNAEVWKLGLQFSQICVCYCGSSKDLVHEKQFASGCWWCCPSSSSCLSSLCPRGPTAGRYR